MRIMKKVIFALAAVVALAACSKEQTVSFDKGAAIGFDTFVDNATRVDDKTLTKDNMSNFAVYGSVTNAGATALIFNNVKVAKDITNDDLKSDWKYQGTQYWINGANYDFAAVAPYKCGAEGAFDASTKKTTIDFTNDGVTDLLYAQTTAEGQAEKNAAVAFTFRHLLSKVKFSFENQYLSTGSTIAVREIKLTNAHETASVTLDATNTAWTGHDGSVLINFGNTENTTGVAATSIAQGKEWESENVRFIIPGAEYTYTVSFLVDVLYGTTVVETYEHTASLTFAPTAGAAYDIKTVISHTNIDPDQAQEPIEFTVNEFDGWAAPVEKEAAIN